MSNHRDLNGWSERRPRAWRRGRMLPIWQGSFRIRPLHRSQISKSIQTAMKIPTRYTGAGRRQCVEKRNTHY